MLEGTPSVVVGFEEQRAPDGVSLLSELCVFVRHSIER